MGRKQKKYHYIYKTTNLINGKYYIGMHSTDNLKDGYIGSGKRLWYSIKKYGKENFKCEILEFLPDRSSLKLKENEIVNETIIKDKLCLNIVRGGVGGIFDDNHAKKLKEGASKWAKSMWLNDEYREKTSQLLRNNMKKNHILGKIKYNTFEGKSHTKETKEKIGVINSINQKGVKNSQYGTCWITNGELNKKIKKTNLIPDGWELGRKINHRINYPMTDGFETID